MKSRIPALMSAITLFATLAILTWSTAWAQQDGENVTSTSNAVPLINQPLVPDAIKPGGAGFNLTVNGTGFVSGSIVHWNGNARTTKFVSSSKLTANILVSDIAVAATASVTLVSPSPGGGDSNVVFFAVAPSSSIVALNRADHASGTDPQFLAVGDFDRNGTSFRSCS